MITRLKNIWTDLASTFSTDKQFIHQLWEEIRETYHAPSRHYHNLGHIDYLLRQALANKYSLSDPEVVLLAIFYHDFIYDIHRNDNEERSALQAVERLNKLKVPNDQIQKCTQLIIASKDHISSGDKDTDYFLDFDLAILGESLDQYKSHAIGVRKEFEPIPAKVYINGRRKILMDFLARPRIFYTKEYYEKLEMKARKNILWELAQLESKDHD